MSLYKFISYGESLFQIKYQYGTATVSLNMRVRNVPTIVLFSVYLFVCL